MSFSQKNGVVRAPFAADVRNGKVSAINVYFN